MEAHRNIAAGAAQLGDCPAAQVPQKKRSVLRDIVDPNDAFPPQNPADCALWTRLRRIALHKLRIGFGDVMECDRMEPLAVIGQEDAEIRLTQAGRFF